MQTTTITQSTKIPSASTSASVPAPTSTRTKSIRRGKLSSVQSSWIGEIGYHQGFLVVFLNETAVIYKDCPSWLKGLVMAGMWKSDGQAGHWSVGRAYCKLVKGRYESQVVKSVEEVKQLRAMFA